ncbi:MMPL/RND family transporter [Nocardia camponoti]|uniref:Membrane protein, MmpL family n=1 Tax=Nocardia camponoti TaxID=1616106 RepID=A0A917V7T4_9NOCA|nr:RND family transporter [Nocardia camponoti]GGK47301.1 putative membrane protein, MmpL family [Nocardia camponoti]
MRINGLDRFGDSVRRFRYVVVFAWLLVAGLGNLAVPQLETTVFASSTPMVPTDTPAAKVLATMGERFGETTSSGGAYLLLTRAQPLGEVDRAYYTKVVAALSADRAHVEAVNDLWASSTTAGSVLSADGKAVYLGIRLVGDTGTTDATRSLTAVNAIIDSVPAPPGLAVNVTGPSPTFADELGGIHDALTIITLLTVVLITVLLLLTYRSIATTFVALITIGMALGAGRAVVSLLGIAGLPTSIFSVALLSAMVLGAGTDYAIFFISRYHEGRRAGLEVGPAYQAAYRRITPIVLASGLIIVVTCATMTATRIGVFRTIGIPCAAGVAVTVLAAITLTPALLAIAAEWGRAEPRGRASNRYWHRLATLIGAHPARMLAASLAVIAALALVLPTLALSYDERATQPDDTPSNRGYAAADAHYPTNELLPTFLLIQADHDLRNSADYAALESIANELSKVAGVAQVRSITRPLGTPIAEAAVDKQLGMVSSQLSGAAVRLDAAKPDIARLTGGLVQLNDGARALADGMTSLTAGASQAAGGSTQLVDGSKALVGGLNQLVDGATQLDSAAQQLRVGSAQLAAGVDSALAPAQPSLAAIDGLRAMVSADPHCATVPLCAAASAALAAFDGSALGAAVGEVTRLRDGVRLLADGNAQLGGGIGQLLTGLRTAQSGATTLSAGQTQLHQGIGALDAGLGQASGGANTLADGTGQVRDGVGQMTTVLTELPTGLGQAVTYLQELQQNPTLSASNGAFNLPTFALGNADLVTASRYFLSPDGHSARMMVLGTADAFSAEGMALASSLADAATAAAARTPLQTTSIDAAGLAATYVDLRALAFRDLATIVIAASLLILLVLAITLRSVIAPLYVFGTVLASYLAALGLSALLWQHLLDKPLHWAVPAMSFIALTAVGADYNLLLMSRVRDELLDDPAGGIRGAVTRAVTQTGGVITTAGVVFALTMVALMFSDITNIAQIGFTIAVGLLLDTLVVRTVTIPSLALLVGRWNWWPSRLSRPTVAKPVADTPASEYEVVRA